MPRIVQKLGIHYVAWRPFWILGRQWSKMAAQKSQDDLLLSWNNKLQEKSCWQELRKKSQEIT